MQPGIGPTPPSGKLDWRIGLTCKPKYRSDPRYYERGTIRDVHPNGTGNIFDDNGVLQIQLIHSGETILARADDWVTA